MKERKLLLSVCVILTSFFWFTNHSVYAETTSHSNAGITVQRYYSSESSPDQKASQSEASENSGDHMMVVKADSLPYTDYLLNSSLTIIGIFILVFSSYLIFLSIGKDHNE